MNCNKCGKKFKIKSKYEKHMAENICDPRVCHICNMNFTAKSMLERHKKSQSHKDKEILNNIELTSEVKSLKKELKELRQLLSKKPKEKKEKREPLMAEQAQPVLTINNAESITNDNHVDNSIINNITNNVTYNIINLSPEGQRDFDLVMTKHLNDNMDVKILLHNGFLVIFERSNPPIYLANLREQIVQSGPNRKSAESFFPEAVEVFRDTLGDFDLSKLHNSKSSDRYYGLFQSLFTFDDPNRPRFDYDRWHYCIEQYASDLEEAKKQYLAALKDTQKPQN